MGGDTVEYDKFLEETMRKAQLKTSGDGQRMIRAVIETLGERLGDHEQKDLRAELPRQMKGWIHQRPNGEPFPLGEFYDRVARRADLTDSQAMAITRIILGLLRQAVSAGEMHDILETLPNDYRQAFFMEESALASGDAGQTGSR